MRELDKAYKQSPHFVNDDKKDFACILMFKNRFPQEMMAESQAHKNKIVFYFAQYNLFKRHTRAIVILNEATAQTSTKSNIVHLYCKSTDCSND